MRPHHRTLNRQQVHHSVSRFLQEHLPLRHYKRSVTVTTLSGPGLFTPPMEIGGDRSRVGPASGTVTVGVPAHALVVLALSRS